MDSDRGDTRRDPPQEWLDALERGRADIAAGRTAPWSEVKARLLARIAFMEQAEARRKA
jgi:predicted transcriptional regulator